MEGKDKDLAENSKFEIDRYISLFDKRAVEVDLNRSINFIEKHYKMDHPRRGKAIIFNHSHFVKGYRERKGTNSDVKNLRKALLSLGFQLEDIIIHEDLKAADISDELKKVQQEDHKDRDLLMVFVLSHGNYNDKVSAFDVEYPTETLWQPFTADKCPTLAGKPKIFFIMACRGSAVDQGQELIIENESVTEVDAKPIKNLNSYSLPIWSDFLFVYSTYKECRKRKKRDLTKAGPSEEDPELPDVMRRKIQAGSFPKKQKPKIGKKWSEERKNAHSERMKEYWRKRKANKGYLSYRNTDFGTWYTQAFCEELSKVNISQISFTDFLTAVNGHVSMLFEAVESKSTRKQTPVYSSTLTKGLYFTVNKK